MKKASVFDFLDYKAYLLFWIRNREKGGRGLRTQIAEAAQCQTAYVSQVLNGGANFSSEQAMALNVLLGHSKAEARFFLLLVEYGRAGTKELRQHFRELIEEALEAHLNLKERFKVQEVLKDEDKVIYYSDWLYSAIHVLVSIPEFQLPHQLSAALRMPEAKIKEILQYLTRTGLVVEEGGKYRMGATRIHVGTDSPLLNRHHSNWRVQSLKALDRDHPEDQRYTSIVSLSRSDVRAIKKRLIAEIEAFNEIVRPSKEEVLYCFNLDFFSVL